MSIVNPIDKIKIELNEGLYIMILFTLEAIKNLEISLEQ